MPDNFQGYLGADDFEGSSPIGYDEQEIGWQDEDSFLRGIDDEIASIEGEEVEDESAEVVGGEEIGDEEIGRRMKGRARRMERLERTEGKVKDRLRNARPGSKRKKRLLKRAARIDRNQADMLDKQQRQAERRANRKGGGRGNRRAQTAAALAAGGAAGAAAMALSRRNRGGRGDDDMDGTYLDLPPGGKLVRVPLLYSSNVYASLQQAIDADGQDVSLEMVTAGITYAKLRVRGFVARVVAKGTAGDLGAQMIYLNSGKVDGGIDLFYGKQLGTLQARTTTQADGTIFVPCVRDDSIIFRNAVVRCTIGLISPAAVAAIIYAFGQIELICERVDDPLAEAVP